MNGLDINKIWIEVLEKLEKIMPQSTFEPWVLPLVPQSLDENGLTILCGHTLAIQILKKNYYKLIKQAVCDKLQKEVEINLIYSEELSQKLKKKNSKSKTSNQQEQNSIAQIKYEKYDTLKQMQSSCNLNLKYTFDNFVPGENNKLAFVASQSVAQNPGKKYNPLFLYGSVGLGKTHLMQAIGHYALQKYPSIKVKYTKTEDFINDYINCVFKSSNKNDKMNSFRQKYRSVDILLIDDIQFIEGKERTEVEIFNTFEALYNSGKQLVIASDRPPSAIPNLSDRLKSRFEWGLMADIQIPDLENRAAILSKLCQNNDIILPNEVIFFLAKIYNKNIRELEGAFTRVCAYSQINNQSIDIENVKKIINYNENKQKITIHSVILTVCDYFKIHPDDIIGSLRSAKISMARQIAIYLCRNILNENFVTIGKAFNKKHTTIMYSFDKIQDSLAKGNSNLRSIVEFLQNKLT